MAVETLAENDAAHPTGTAPPVMADTSPPPPLRGERFLDAALLAYGRGFEHPCKIRILHWLIRWLAAGRINVRHISGAVLTIDPQDYIGWAIFKTGGYEPASLALAMRIMTAEPGLFVDVGANFGWYTCAVAAVAGTRVLSVEPDSGNCAALRANVARNRFANVTIFDGAVGAKSTLLAMSRRAGGNSGTVAVAQTPATGEDRYWVAAMPLDAVLAILVSPPARPVLLKIDVEGFEPEVLAGLDFAGPFRPKNVLIEYEPAFCAEGWGSFTSFAAFFAQRGYDLFDVTGAPIAGERPLPEENVWARDRNQAA